MEKPQAVIQGLSRDGDKGQEPHLSHHPAETSEGVPAAGRARGPADFVVVKQGKGRDPVCDQDSLERVHLWETTGTVTGDAVFLLPFCHIDG